MYGTSSVPVKYVIVEGNYSLAGYGFEKSSFGARQGWGGGEGQSIRQTKTKIGLGLG